VAGGGTPDQSRIVRIVLEGLPRIRLSAQVEQERRAALYDLIEDNCFRLTGGPAGPYVLGLSLEGDRLILDVGDEGERPLARVGVPLVELRRLIKDYFLILDSYFHAIRTMSPSRIEAIDMGRRGLHDEGADILQEQLKPKVAVDRATARRLFTLLCVLHIRG
jgi:uncharacterized protein (UPF0262 family)